MLPERVHVATGPVGGVPDLIGVQMGLGALDADATGANHDALYVVQIDAGDVADSNPVTLAYWEDDCVLIDDVDACPGDSEEVHPTDLFKHRADSGRGHELIIPSPLGISSGVGKFFGDVHVLPDAHPTPPETSP